MNTQDILLFIHLLYNIPQNTRSVFKHAAKKSRVNYTVKSAVVWRNAVTRGKEEISVNIDSIDPWNLKFLCESTETCGGMEAVHYRCDIR